MSLINREGDGLRKETRSLVAEFMRIPGALPGMHLYAQHASLEMSVAVYVHPVDEVFGLPRYFVAANDIEKVDFSRQFSYHPKMLIGGLSGWGYSIFGDENYKLVVAGRTGEFSGVDLRMVRLDNHDDMGRVRKPMKVMSRAFFGWTPTYIEGRAVELEYQWSVAAHNPDSFSENQRMIHRHLSQAVPEFAEAHFGSKLPGMRTVLLDKMPTSSDARQKLIAVPS